MNVDELFQLGLRYVERRDWNKAVELFLQVVELKPDHAEAWCHLSMAHLDNEDFGQITRDNLLKAKGFLEKAVRYKPDYPLAWYFLGNVNLRLKEVSEAIKAFQNAVEQDPEYIEAWVSLGLAHEMIGELSKTIQCIQKASELKPNDPMLRQLLSVVKGRHSNLPER